jgi:serine protease AprX
VDGTSVAAPIVSSVIAQMLEANPDLTPEQIRTILKQTAIPLDSIPAEKQGAGAINARGAVEAALQFRANFSYPTE